MANAKNCPACRPARSERQRPGRRSIEGFRKQRPVDPAATQATRRKNAELRATRVLSEDVPHKVPEAGDSARPVRPSSKAGTSRHSFHYCARAVDISQDFTKAANHRYFIASEPRGSQQFWRLWCKADKQDGSQGLRVRKHTQKHHQFNPSAEVWIPEGYYVDLTTLIESTNAFERIHAQAGWQGVYNKSEWWHFQFKKDKQPTFLDEMELIGYTEARLRACGWNSDALLDHPPG